MNDKQQCAHEGCDCPVAEGQQFCSEACKAAPPDGKCPCGHSGCHGAH